VTRVRRRTVANALSIGFGIGMRGVDAAASNDRPVVGVERFGVGEHDATVRDAGIGERTHAGRPVLFDAL
jgi:hypothetical protein